ncbi:GNAT family N-acetyltransferase [Microlunatus speluncae]|uniref:GNAT family N-acetyltransferase n=1 Tax=Microlunatus speluncae TaxID=2594267 RepID=UPI0012666DBE|nr:GNAT family N-acetyltransferase [Microlunatus speluncae]
MTVSARPLTDDDAEASRRLGWEAFGAPGTPPTEPPPPVAGEGRCWYGAFLTDDSGTERLSARMLDRYFETWIGGRRVPTAGIAGVTTAAEDRGRGLLSPLFGALLAGAHERGAVISSLFPTAPKIYRRFGYEVVGDLVEVEVPTAVLAAVDAPAGGSVRRAVAADVPAIFDCYGAWAATQHGPLTREGAAFASDRDGLLNDFTGVTVALDDHGTITGYALWDRGGEYGPGSSIKLEEVIATTPDAYRGLLRTLGSFASVTPAIKITTAGFDVIRSLLPALDWQVIKRSPYMINVIDIAGALTKRGYRYGFEAVLDFSVADHFLDACNGSYRLRVAGGRGRCERIRPEPEQRQFTARGLAALYAGALPVAELRAAGLLTGGDPATDSLWDGAFGAPALQIRDYF